MPKKGLELEALSPREEAKRSEAQREPAAEILSERRCWRESKDLDSTAMPG